jgi:hypothetical protein
VSRRIRLEGLRPAVAVSASWPTFERSDSEAWRHHSLALDPDLEDFTEEFEIQDEELEEFLACDLDPVEADPVFKERLREQLWAIVQNEGSARRQDH